MNMKSMTQFMAIQLSFLKEAGLNAISIGVATLLKIAKIITIRSHLILQGWLILMMHCFLKNSLSCFDLRLSCFFLSISKENWFMPSSSGSCKVSAFPVCTAYMPLLPSEPINMVFSFTLHYSFYCFDIFFSCSVSIAGFSADDLFKSPESGRLGDGSPGKMFRTLAS